MVKKVAAMDVDVRRADPSECKMMLDAISMVEKVWTAHMCRIMCCTPPLLINEACSPKEAWRIFHYDTNILRGSEACATLWEWL